MRILNPYFGDNKDFVTTWDTSITSTFTSTNSDQLALPLIAGTVLDITINWGDGTIENYISSDDVPIHTYSSAGVYTVKITKNDGIGRIGFHFNNAPAGRQDRQKLLNISNFGNVEIFQPGTGINFRLFRFCTNMTVTAKDAYERMMGIITNFDEMFQSCNSLTGFPGMEDWDMSHVLNFNEVFSGCNINGYNLNNWNVSNCTNFTGMFASNQNFNSPLNDWDITSAGSIASMFTNCTSFNQPLNLWDVSSISNMGGTFSGCSVFNQDLSSWNTGSVNIFSTTFSNTNSMDFSTIEGWDTSAANNMFRMFFGTTMGSPDFSSWNVSLVTNFEDMFRLSNFSGSVSGWTLKPAVSNVSCDSMFESSNFNGIVNNWSNTSSISDMSNMFFNSNFDQPVNNWDTSSCTDMGGMFRGTPFNQTVTNFNTSLVGSFAGMFQSASSFNQDVQTFSLTNSTSFQNMFNDADAFNQPMAGFNFGSRSVNLNGMFANCAIFNQDISGWDVSNVSDFTTMFLFSPAFNQDLSSWDISSATSMVNFGNGAGFDVGNYSRMLREWAALPVPPSDITINVSSNYYSTEEVVDGRNTLDTTYNWSITDLGVIQGFVIADTPEDTVDITATAGTFANLRGLYVEPDGGAAHLVSYAAPEKNVKFIFNGLNDMSSVPTVENYGSLNAQPWTIFYRPTGARLYIGVLGNTIQQYDPTVAFETTPNTGAGAVGLQTTATNTKNSYFTPDGLQMYISRGNIIEAYDLGTAWDVTTRVYDQDVTFPLFPGEAVQGVVFADSGNRAIVVTSNNPVRLALYDLSIAYDITSTLTFIFDTFLPIGAIWGVAKPDADGFLYLGDSTVKELYQHLVEYPV